MRSCVSHIACEKCVTRGDFQRLLCAHFKLPLPVPNTDTSAGAQESKPVSLHPMMTTSRLRELEAKLGGKARATSLQPVAFPCSSSDTSKERNFRNGVEGQEEKAEEAEITLPQDRLIRTSSGDEDEEKMESRMTESPVSVRLSSAHGAESPAPLPGIIRLAATSLLEEEEEVIEEEEVSPEGARCGSYDSADSAPLSSYEGPLTSSTSSRFVSSMRAYSLITTAETSCH